MVGIYKITSPNGRIYIGQSNNIERRFKEYENLNNCKKQLKLFRSFLKYGVINHIFEFIEECLIEELNIKERYYQELFDCVENGLNCFYTKTNEKPRINSKEYKQKISDTLKKKYKSNEIVHYNKGNGEKFNIFDYKGNMLYENIDVENIIKNINLSNRSVINNIIRNNKFLSQKKYIIIPCKYNFKDYVFNSIQKYKGSDLPIYQIFDNGDIKKCSISSKFRIINKLLISENYIYYSKKNKSHYTFIGLINAVLNRNILDN